MKKERMNYSDMSKTVTARKIVELAKQRGNAASDEILYDALEKIEDEICEKCKLDKKEFDRNGNLYAPKMYSDMYVEFLMREAALVREDWDTYNAHNSIFTGRYTSYLQYMLRKNTPKEQKISCPWKW